MSLEKLSLVNFQKHKKLALTFDPHVTTIVGKNDIGKSAIFRALRWLALNKPAGDRFKRRGKPFVKAALAVDGRTVIRTKGDANLYKIDGKKLAAFGAGKPPDAIADLLNLDAVNFQSQFGGGPYWFTLTPGQVAKELNRIVDLTSIDRTLGKIAAKVRRCKAEADVARDRLADAETRLKETAGVPELASDWQELEKIYKKVQETREKASRIAQAQNDRLNALSERDRALALGKSAYSALLLGGSWQETGNQAAKLRQLLAELIEAERNRADAEAGAVRAKEAVGKLGNRCPVCGGKWNPKK